MAEGCVRAVQGLCAAAAAAAATAAAKSLQSRPTLCDPIDPTRLLCPWNSPDKNAAAAAAAKSL